MLVYDYCACKIREVEKLDPACDVLIPDRLYLTYEGRWEASTLPTHAWTEITFIRLEVVVAMIEEAKK